MLPRPPEVWRLPLQAIILGLTAGLCEELARYATYRWWVKSARTWKEGMMLGAGHGGVESILCGLLVLVSLGSMLYLQSVGTGMIPEQHRALADQQLAQYWSVPLFWPLVGVLERIFALITHLAMSLVVLQVFVRAQSRWLWAAVLWHAGVDATAVYTMNRWGTTWCEVAVAAWAAAGLVVIWRLSRAER